MVTGHVSEDGTECSDAYRMMPGNGEMVLALLERSETKMAFRLSRNAISQDCQCFNNLISREVTGQPHAGMTSSLTW